MPPVTPRFTFTKNERLKSRKLIAELFTQGKSIVIAPIRLVWIPALLPATTPAQIAFSVPAKNFKRAVDRNYIKRQMREVYRKNKQGLYTLLMDEQKQCAMMLVFMGKTKVPFEEIENKLTLTLLRFEEDFKKHAK